jgi:PRTRC genetic system ThiF family protein
MIEIDKYIIEPTHKITFHVVGVGGTGSHVLNNLARMHKVLKMLEHPGITVTAYDPDIIENNNIGRQLFYPQDINKNKAVVLISRINRTYGLDWSAEPIYYNEDMVSSNILITCIDRIDVRLSLSYFTYIGKNHLSVFSKPIYWIDVGNNKMNGQIYLDDYGEKFQRYHDIFGKQIVNIDEDNKSDGCNIINSLNEQELFINEFMANLTVDFIYRILKNRIINHNLIFADLLNYNIQIDKKLKL